MKEGTRQIIGFIGVLLIAGYVGWVLFFSPPGFQVPTAAIVWAAGMYMAGVGVT